MIIYYTTRFNPFKHNYEVLEHVPVLEIMEVILTFPSWEEADFTSRSLNKGQYDRTKNLINVIYSSPPNERKEVLNDTIYSAADKIA